MWKRQLAYVGTLKPAMFRQDVYYDTPDENNGRLYKVENETTYQNSKLTSIELSNTPQCQEAQVTVPPRPE